MSLLTWTNPAAAPAQSLCPGRGHSEAGQEVPDEAVRPRADTTAAAECDKKPNEHANIKGPAKAACPAAAAAENSVHVQN